MLFRRKSVDRVGGAGSVSVTVTHVDTLGIRDTLRKEIRDVLQERGEYVPVVDIHINYDYSPTSINALREQIRKIVNEAELTGGNLTITQGIGTMDTW